MTHRELFDLLKEAEKRRGLPSQVDGMPWDGDGLRALLEVLGEKIDEPETPA